MNELQTILDAEWVVAEEQNEELAEESTVVCTPTKPEPKVYYEDDRFQVVEGSPFVEAIVAVFLWLIFTAVLALASIATSATLFPLFDSIVFTLVWIALGLFLTVLMAIAVRCNNELPAAMCTASRATLTGRE